MAFKFKVKKRPNPIQTALQGFSAGVIQGGNQALQNMINENKEKKNQSQKELNTFNSVISGVPQTPSNLSKIIAVKSSIATGSLTAEEGLATLGIDSLEFQTETDRIKIAKKQSDALDKVIPNVEANAMKVAGMTGIQPTKMEVAKRTDDAKKNIGLKGVATPAKTLLEKQFTETEKLLIQNASLVGLSVDSYMNDYPTAPEVVLYKKLKGISDTKPQGEDSTIQGFNIPIPEPAIPETTSVYNNLEPENATRMSKEVLRADTNTANTQMIAVNPQTGEKLYYDAESNSWQPLR